MSKVYSEFVYSDEQLTGILALKNKLILSEKTKRIINKLTKQISTSKKRFKGHNCNNNRFNTGSRHKTFVSKISTDVEVNKHYRAALNKVTMQVNQHCINNIEEKINLMLKHHKSYTNEVVDIFFSVTFAGSLYISSFVQIYSKLKNKVDPNHIINLIAEKIVPFCKTLHYIDTEEDYPLFCEVTKQKDYYRYVSLFVSELLSYEKDPYESIYVYLVELFTNTLKECIDQTNQRECCDEIIEHLKILLTKTNIRYMESNSCLNNNAFSEWEDYLNDIQHLKTYSVRDCESLSLRASFMINDICECINF